MLTDAVKYDINACVMLWMSVKVSATLALKSYNLKIFIQHMIGKIYDDIAYIRLTVRRLYFHSTESTTVMTTR